MWRCRIPGERGLPFSNWSVPKLAEYCRSKGLLPEVTDEWVRRLLRREGLSAQRIRTWKTSNDPRFDAKKNASDSSTATCPRRAAVVCFDEWGPLELRPIGGVAWAKRKHPVRRRATYRRLQGTEQFLGFYDVHDDCLEGLFLQAQARSRRLPSLPSDCGSATRGRRLYVVLDNLHNVHDHPTVLALMRNLHIHPVWTPTEASWLNLIEAQFGVLKRFTVANTDDPAHAGQAAPRSIAT